ncbi:MAG: DNA repair protein RecN [Omnitrophica WOR_2 bacterium]|jgi:DNA repair protein RecN (Recombination protein N)
MLNRLSVNNYALIRNLDIEFNKPFSVITGETGAGKSIILGALSLMLGSRADNLTLPDKTKKCSIEGCFDITTCELESFFEENNLDYDHSCIIRREITPQGKSRAFINDTPVNLNQLKDLTSRLIDVHSQHQTLLLRENSFQLSVVDAVADNHKLLKQYKETYKAYIHTTKQLDETRALNLKAKIELDYLVFVIEEFQKALLIPGEQEALEEELDVQSHAEDIKTKLFNASEILNGEEESIIKKLREVTNLVNAASLHYNDIKSLTDRLNSSLIELKDIAAVIEDIVEKVSFSSERMEEINERLSLIYKLEQKHHVNSISELNEIATSFQSRIQGIESLDQKAEELEKIQKQYCLQMISLADELSSRRKNVSSTIENSIISTVSNLGIKNASFKIEFATLDFPGKDGKDEVEFLFSANKGIEPDNITRIASGGELSRLMLAVKSLISINNLLPTIVFDEIDTGISGEIAGKVGNILKTISGNMQVIAITHLPQIAALGDSHYKVFKMTSSDSTWSMINKLNREEQIDELALMISGNNKLQGAREAAQELMRGPF